MRGGETGTTSAGAERKRWRRQKGRERHDDDEGRRTAGNGESDIEMVCNICNGADRINADTAAAIATSPPHISQKVVNTVDSTHTTLSMHPATFLSAHRHAVSRHFNTSHYCTYLSGDALGNVFSYVFLDFYHHRSYHT